MNSNASKPSNLRTWSALSATVLVLGFLPATTGSAAAADSDPSLVKCTITGTPMADVLVGGPGADVLCGLGGDDRIAGQGGNDVLRGGLGDDRLLGGDGDDELQGGRHDDVLIAGLGDDDLRGGWGADTLHGHDGARFRDDLRCGPGRGDRALADANDDVAASCEEPATNAAPTDLSLSPAAVPENSAVGTQVGILSVTDPDAGDTHTLSLVTGSGDTDNASFTIAGQRLLTAKGFDFEADPSLSVRVRGTDGAGASYVEVLVVSVTDVAENGAPGAVDDTFSTPEDTTLALPVAGPGSPAANDQDTDPLSVTDVASASGGTVSLTAGTIRFVPAADRCGTSAGGFAYTVADGRGGTATGRASVDVTCLPDDPTATDDAATRTEDDAASAVDVLANDDDADGDALDIDAVTQPDNGTVAITGAGTGLTYEPDAGYCNTASGGAPDTFAYTLSPGGATATVSMTVTCQDDAPAAVDDTATVDEDADATAIAVLGNDTDSDGGPQDVQSVSDPAHGTATVTDDGVAYEPDANYCNTAAPATTDSFTYTLNGGSQATVRVAVTCVQDAPVAVDDTATVTEDASAAAVTVLTNDTDVDGGPKSVESVTQPEDGTVTITGAGTGLTYAPDANYCNDPGAALPDTFTYTLNGGSVGTVRVTVTCVDDAPVAVDDAATVAEDAAATAIAVRTNDTDIDAGTKSIESTTQPADGTVAITGGGTGLSYRPDANYCNSPGAPGDDTFTYTLNGGSSATVSVAVTCVDDNPVAVNDAETVFEDATATAIAVLGNDTDVDAGTKSIASVSQPVHGTAAITGGGTGLTYKPDADYCNSGTGGTPDTFTYTLNGGSTATVSVTVTCDVPPSAVNDAATLAEDAVATALDVLANDTNPDGGPKKVASVTDPAHGTATLTLDGVSYAPDADYCNSVAGDSVDTFTYTLNGGSEGTVSVTVTCVDDKPVAVADEATVAEDASATGINVLANDTDVDAGPKAIASVTQPAHGTVVRAGDGSGLTYAPDADYCNTGGTDADTFSYELNGGSTATVSVTVTCADDPPAAVADDATVTEDDPATAIAVLANDTDDFGSKIVASVVQPTNGEVVITGDGTGLTYQPDLNYCNSASGGTPDTFTYKLNGGSEATVSVTVTCVDDAPAAVADTATVAVNAPATQIDVLDNDTDVDGGTTLITDAAEPAHGTVVVTDGTELTYEPDADYCNSDSGGTPDTFTYTVNGGSSATVAVTVTCDVLPVAVNDSATVGEDGAASEIDVLTNDPNPDGGPKSVATVSDPTNGTTSLTLGGVSYTPDANYCNSASGGTPDTFTYKLNGGSEATVSVTVTCVDDVPTAVADADSVAEDAGATAVLVMTNDTDIDQGPKSIASVTQPANGSVVITGGGTGLTYAPNANYCNQPPGTTPDTFTYKLNGGSIATVSMTVTCVNDAPAADDDTVLGAIGNTTLIADDATDGAPTSTSISRTVAGDLLEGDVDVDGPGPLVITAGTFATTDGGTVVLEADGDFVFTPAAGTSCTDTSDSFDYTVSDQGIPDASDTGTVTVGIDKCVRYVSNNASGNAGTSSAPFDTLADAQTQSNAGDTIFVFDGDNTSTGYAAGFDLKADQRLLGEAADLQVGGVLLHSGVSTARPTITDPVTDVVVLASGNTVRGIQVDPHGGGGIVGASGDNGGTIHDVLVTDAGTAGIRPGLDLLNTSGTWSVSGLRIQNGGSSSALGIRLINAGTVNLVSTVGPNTVSTTGAKALAVADTQLGTASVIADITVTGSSSGAVSLTNTAGTISLGDGFQGDLSLTGITGTTAAFLLTNAGNVTVPDAGTSNVSITGGPAINVTGTAGASLSFDDVDSVNSVGDGTNAAGDGINLAGLGSGTFSAGLGSTITNAGAVAFDLDGGTGNVTYDGTITSGPGQLVRVQATTGGVKDFNGSIADTVDGGGGISLLNNAGATVRFDGGVAVRTTITPAFAATGGGTVAVVDPAGSNNTLQTTTGTALNVTNTTIADDDLTFERVSSNGATNGIVLSATGNSLGRLFVTGAAGTCTVANTTCTGGSILGSTGAGISLTNVPGGVTLNNVRVANGGDDGIRATSVVDIDLTDVIVTGNGNLHTGGLEERGLDYLDVTGTPHIVRTAVTGSDDSNAHIQNSSGTTTLVVTGSTFSDSKNNAGLRLRGAGTSVMTANVTASTFSLNADPGFSMQTDSDNTAKQTLVFDDNDVSGGSTTAAPGRPQVSINSGGTATVRARVSNNDIKSAAGAEVILNTLASHNGSFDMLVVNNEINDAQPGVLDPLADGGSGIWGWAHGDGATRMEIRNNLVANSGGRALELSHNDGNGTADYIVSGNTFGKPDATANTYEGAYIFTGGATGDTSNMCVDLTGNTMAGIGNQGVSDIGLDRYGSTQLRFAGFNGTDVTVLRDTNLRPKNPASAGLTIETFGNGPTATTAATCTAAQNIP